MAIAPISPKAIPITEDDGKLDERYMPDRLAEGQLDPPVDLVLLFENGMA